MRTGHGSICAASTSLFMCHVDIFRPPSTIFFVAKKTFFQDLFLEDLKLLLCLKIKKKETKHFVI
jgi:hypothetical protein